MHPHDSVPAEHRDQGATPLCIPYNFRDKWTMLQMMTLLDSAHDLCPLHCLRPPVVQPPQNAALFDKACDLLLAVGPLAGLQALDSHQPWRGPCLPLAHLYCRSQRVGCL